MSLCKAPGIDGKWNFPGKGYEEPFVLFDEKEDAYACATELKNSSAGVAAPLDEDDGFSPLPSHGDRIGFRGAGQAANAR